MSGETHRVGCARFRIAAPDHAALLQWRTRLEAAGTGDLEEALDAALKGILPEDELLVIDRLEVDLGEFAADDFDLPGLVSATREALHRAAVLAQRHAYSPAPRVSGPGSGAGDGQPPYRMKLSRSAEAALLGYLATGRLDPAAPFASLGELYRAIETAPAANEVFRRFLLSAASSARAAALLRLFATAPRDLTRALFAGGFPDVPEAALPMLDRGSSPTAGDLSNFSDARSRLMQSVTDTLAALDAAHPAPEGAGETRSDGLDPQSAPGGLPCANAGLVLLHPYLEPYFEGIGLMREQSFTDPEARATAARLLHVVATGNPDHEEPDLVIPRLLCAVPDDQPVLPLAALEPGHMEEGERMLAALIEAWKGIGHATPDGIRETFLQRPGVLTGSAGALRLTVERSGVDILLDRLPWALSLITLPWLSAPLKVDWT